MAAWAATLSPVVHAALRPKHITEDLARRTLLQSLTVRPVVDEGGEQTGRFEIPGDGRRYRALALLVSENRLAKAPQSAIGD